MAEFGNFIIYIIMAGTLIGALASIVKPEGELGREFVNGIHAIGPVFLAGQALWRRSRSSLT